MAILWGNRLGGREKHWWKKYVVVMGGKSDRIILRVEEKNGGAQARPMLEAVRRPLFVLNLLDFIPHLHLSIPVSVLTFHICFFYYATNDSGQHWYLVFRARKTNFIAQQGVRPAKEMKRLLGSYVIDIKELSVNFLIETLCIVLQHYVAQVHLGLVKLLAQEYGRLNRFYGLSYEPNPGYKIVSMVKCF